MKKEHEQIVRLLQMAEDRNCTTCMYWRDNPTELCDLFKVRPPAKVIIVGCEHHDYIPY